MSVKPCRSCNNIHKYPLTDECPPLSYCSWTQNSKFSNNIIANTNNPYTNVDLNNAIDYKNFLQKRENSLKIIDRENNFLKLNYTCNK